MKKLILVLICTHPLPWLVMPAAAQDQADRLAAQVEAIAAPLVGRVGFAAQLIGSDKIISHSGDMTFPMASTYKVPAAVTLLKRVEAGELKLDHCAVSVAAFFLSRKCQLDRTGACFQLVHEPRHRPHHSFAV
jgi:hypothetical protein